MHWRKLLAMAVVLSGCTGCTGEVDAILHRAEKLAASGQAEEALRGCRESRVEFPDSPDLLFGTGSAEIALAEERLRAHRPDEAAEQFQAAQATFGRVAEGMDYRLREAAHYNAATCLLRLDDTIHGAGAYEARIENLGHAIAALEVCAELYPGNERVQKNLDYARYTLNRLRQSPPRDSESEQNQEQQDESALSEVNSATTDLPGATAEVVEGSTVVLHIAPGPEGVK